VSGSPRRVALDASALLAWVLRERGHDTVDKILAFAVIPSSAMVETLYRARERGHGQSSAALHADLLALGLTVESVADTDTVRAAELISTSKADPDVGSLSLGDGLCIAVAERLQLPVTGGDRCWAQVDATVPFLPFR
jgi:PIN domain nuclease of toxin-antitoxin system